MQSLNINLCVFDSSKGHFGRIDIYKKTIDDLYNSGTLSEFSNLYAHIKTASNCEENAVLQEQIKFYTSYGFKILISEGDWKHFDSSHQLEYSKDLITLYDWIDHNPKYTLHLEADWLFSPNNGRNLIDYLELAKQYLSQRKGVVSVRFPRFANEVNRLNGLKAKHNLDVVCEQDINNPKFWRHNDNISLNPTLFRTSDIRFATRILELNPHFQQHVEMGFGHCFKLLSRDKLIHSFIDPNEINVCHIGTKEGEEDIKGQKIISN